MSQTPLIAIVGRPNVGKSTLFNRLVGSRRAIVGDEPGITRDRLYGNSHWQGHDFRVVDTGGILPDEKDFIPAEVAVDADKQHDLRQVAHEYLRKVPGEPTTRFDIVSVYFSEAGAEFELFKNAFSVSEQYF